MSKIDKYFRLAKQVAMKGDSCDASRQHRLGAVGIRSDGIIVSASNIPCRQQNASSHAEARLVRKLNHSSEVFVVRVLRNGELGNAHPCINCQTTMRLRGVRRAYYSISNDDYGIIVFNQR
jgi:tRNA(Arg) A34 adenosine deaminase TadA